MKSRYGLQSEQAKYTLFSSAKNCCYSPTCGIIDVTNAHHASSNQIANWTNLSSSMNIKLDSIHSTFEHSYDLPKWQQSTQPRRVWTTLEFNSENINWIINGLIQRILTALQRFRLQYILVYTHAADPARWPRRKKRQVAAKVLFLIHFASFNWIWVWKKRDSSLAIAIAIAYLRLNIYIFFFFCNQKGMFSFQSHQLLFFSTSLILTRAISNRNRMLRQRVMLNWRDSVNYRIFTAASTFFENVLFHLLR